MCVSGMRPISVVAVSEMVRGNISLHHRHVEKGERGGNTKKVFKEVSCPLCEGVPFASVVLFLIFPLQQKLTP